MSRFGKWKVRVPFPPPPRLLIKGGSYSGGGGGYKTNTTRPLPGPSHPPQQMSVPQFSCIWVPQGPPPLDRHCPRQPGKQRMQTAPRLCRAPALRGIAAAPHASPSFARPPTLPWDCATVGFPGAGTVSPPQNTGSRVPWARVTSLRPCASRTRLTSAGGWPIVFTVCTRSPRHPESMTGPPGHCPCLGLSCRAGPSLAACPHPPPQPQCQANGRVRTSSGLNAQCSLDEGFYEAHEALCTLRVGLRVVESAHSPRALALCGVRLPDHKCRVKSHRWTVAPPGGCQKEHTPEGTTGPFCAPSPLRFGRNPAMVAALRNPSGQLSLYIGRMVLTSHACGHTVQTPGARHQHTRSSTPPAPKHRAIRPHPLPRSTAPSAARGIPGSPA